MSNFHTALVDRVHLYDIESTKWAACKNALRCLANHANESEKDLAWPGVELMMLETGMSESALTRATGILHQKKWIVRKRRFGTSNMYRINRAKLEQNQVARPDPKAVHMVKHLPDMLFPDEKLAELVDLDQLANDKPAVPGRSTARQRAARREREEIGQEKDQVSDPVDNFFAEEPLVGDSSVKSTYSKTRSNTSNRRDCTRQIDVTDPVNLTNKPLENRQTKKNSSVRSVSNASATREQTGADGRTDGEFSAEPNTALESVASVLVGAKALQADLARIDMRPRQRRALIAAVDSALLRFSEAQVARYLGTKAREARTATWLLGACTEWVDAIAEIPKPRHGGDPVVLAAVEAAVATGRASIDTPAPFAPSPEIIATPPIIPAEPAPTAPTQRPSFARPEPKPPVEPLAAPASEETRRAALALVAEAATRQTHKARRSVPEFPRRSAQRVTHSQSSVG